MENQLKGERIRNLFIEEAKQILASYKNIEYLLPSEYKNGSSHPAEEGRYIEYLIRTFLNKHLPTQLKAFTGFIYRPATKTGVKNYNRKNNEIDKHSSQIDIIVFDKANYPIFEKYEEFAIVPPEGVIALISIKKALRINEIEKEIKNLSYAVSLCQHENLNNDIVRGPSTIIFTLNNKIKEKANFDTRVKTIFKKIENSQKELTFDQCIEYIISMGNYIIMKDNPKKKFNNKARYLAFETTNESDYHYSLQFLISSILNSYYDRSRNNISRPGFTSFPSNIKATELGKIEVKKLR